MEIIEACFRLLVRPTRLFIANISSYRHFNNPTVTKNNSALENLKIFATSTLLSFFPFISKITIMNVAKIHTKVE